MRTSTIALLAGLALVGLSLQSRAATSPESSRPSSRQGGSFINTVKQAIAEIAPRYHIPPPLLFGICMAESSCNPSLLNRKHHLFGSSFGLYGLTRIACKDVGVNYDRLRTLTGKDAIYSQTETAAKYLSKIRYTYNGRFGINDWEAAIQAYNVGIGAYKRGKKNKHYLATVLKYARSY